ncbi:MAG: chondroitinase-B domain-containing protein [Polyangiaceae bacterium]
MRLLALLALAALVPGSAFAEVVPVSDEASLEAAIAAAKPGDEIELADGVYASTGISCSANGTPAAPIIVRAANPLGAKIRFDALEGFKVSGDHWHFEGLEVTGVCANDSDCEHAFHVGGASGFVLRGVTAVDFNAQLKVNAVQSGGSWKLPNGGLVEGCDLHDTHPRATSNPVTKLNIDSGDDWVVRGNLIHDYEKGQGDGVSYGAFLKCGGQRGVIEQNLVLCERDFSGGTRIGLSLGGGACAPQFCEPAFDASTACVEHHDGVVRNNIVANCSDVGVYVNASANSRVLYNTLIGTAGIDFRFAATTGVATGNVLAGNIENRNGATATFSDNLENVAQSDFDGWYMTPLTGDLRLKGAPTALLGKGPTLADVTDDYCARARGTESDLGALESSLGDCETTTPPATSSSTGAGATTTGATGAGATGTSSTGSSSSSGSGGAGSDGGADGCSCRTRSGGAISTAELGTLAALALGVALRRRPRGSRASRR